MQLRERPTLLLAALAGAYAPWDGVFSELARGHP